VKMNRRRLLQGLGAGALSIPFLEAAIRPARATTGLTLPKRLIVVHHQQGTVLSEWAPSGSETNFTLPTLTEPLAPFQDRALFVAGVDNRIPPFNTTGNGHDNANFSMLTAMPFLDQQAAVLTAGGPSVEQVIADRISTTTPFRRLDFGVGGGTSGGGLIGSSFLFHGAGDPVAMTNDPNRMFATLFADASLSEAEVAALRSRRGTVLGAVQQSFDALRPRLDRDDRTRLDAHREKLIELESRVTSESGECTAPTLDLPGDYDYGFDDDISTPIMTDLMVEALACDKTRVATMTFVNGHDPTFPWLDVGGEPVVPTGLYDGWHGMVHDGRHEPGLVVGFHWYCEQLAALLSALDARVDTDGENLLDTSLVLWVTEFGNGTGHNTNKIPYVLIGNAGGLQMGRYLDYMNGGPDDPWSPSDFSSNQFLVSLLRMFGGTDQTFGLTDPTLPEGGLPGLL